MNQSDVIIIGGGVIGLVTAYYLHANGASVTLLEKNTIGKESSWAGGGIVSPLYPWRYPDPVNDLTVSGQAIYSDLCESLHQRTGINPEWTQSGLLLTEIPDDMDQLSNWQQKYPQKMIELTGSEQLQQYEPALASTLDRALWFPEVAQVRNPRLIQSLLTDLKNKGINIIENQPFSELIEKDHHAIGVKTPKQSYFSNTVIIASGAWSADLGLTTNIKVKPVMGQMILYKTEPSALTRIIFHHGKYIIPRRDGHVLCGSTLEWNGFNKTTSETARKELAEFATSQIPLLAKLEPIRQWSGLRPGSPNSVPYIGEHAGIKGLYFNTGHYRYGVTMGPASAQLLTDIILNKPTAINADDFSLSAHREQTGEFSFT